MLNSYKHYRVDVSERRELRGRENRCAIGRDDMSVDKGSGASCTVRIVSWDSSAGCNSSAFSSASGSIKRASCASSLRNSSLSVSLVSAGTCSSSSLPRAACVLISASSHTGDGCGARGPIPVCATSAPCTAGRGLSSSGDEEPVSGWAGRARSWNRADRSRTSVMVRVLEIWREGDRTSARFESVIFVRSTFRGSVSTPRCSVISRNRYHS